MSCLSLLFKYYAFRNYTHQAELQGTLLPSRNLTMDRTADAGLATFRRALTLASSELFHQAFLRMALTSEAGNLYTCNLSSSFTSAAVVILQELMTRSRFFGIDFWKELFLDHLGSELWKPLAITCLDQVNGLCVCAGLYVSAFKNHVRCARSQLWPCMLHPSDSSYR
jgi:hypothetical protein